MNVLMVRSLVQSVKRPLIDSTNQILSHSCSKHFASQDLFKNEDEDSTKDVDYTDELVAALLKRED